MKLKGILLIWFICMTITGAVSVVNTYLLQKQIYKLEDKLRKLEQTQGLHN